MRRRQERIEQVLDVRGRIDAFEGHDDLVVTRKIRRYDSSVVATYVVIRLIDYETIKRHFARTPPTSEAFKTRIAAYGKAG